MSSIVALPNNQGEICVMLFCIEADYTPAALTAMRERPANRADATASLCEAAGAKLVAMYRYDGNGPEAMANVDIAAPSTGVATIGVIASSGHLQNVRSRRLFTMDE